jgi:hypothetical protein
LPSDWKTPNLLSDPMQGAMSATPTFAGQSVWAIFSIRSRAVAVAAGF